MKGGSMKKQLINYETLLKVTKAMSMSNRPEEVVQLTVDSVKASLEIKGFALFLIDPTNKALEVAASCGLSAEYLQKGPLSSIRSIGQSLTEGPVAIYDVGDDPRIQYPDAAKKEGIASILAVPIVIGDRLIGSMRVYTAVPWEFTLNDVNFVQAVAQVVGMALEMCRINKGLKDSIDILKTMRDPRSYKSTRRTPYEGVPTSVSADEMPQTST